MVIHTPYSLTYAHSMLGFWVSCKRTVTQKFHVFTSTPYSTDRKIREEVAAKDVLKRGRRIKGNLQVYKLYYVQVQ